jgi:RNA polymerase sigma factor (sigma-70 family)
MDFGDFSIE